MVCYSKGLNNRLPKHLRIDCPTGHSGRHTFISNAINDGVAPEIVAKASKHKDANSLQRYYHEKPITQILIALSVLGESLMKAKEYDDDCLSVGISDKK